MTTVLNNILILGMGSEVLKDDGIPIRIIDDLKKELPVPGLHFSTANNGGLDMLDHFAAYRNVVIIDTIFTGNGRPGQVYSFTPEDGYMESFHLSSYHDATFPVTLDFGKKLGLNIPDRIRIIAIEIIEGLELSSSPSEPLEKMYPEILNSIKTIINQTLREISRESVERTTKEIEV